jgi:hypothetical protein
MIWENIIPKFVNVVLQYCVFTNSEDLSTTKESTSCVATQ